MVQTRSSMKNPGEEACKTNADLPSSGDQSVELSEATTSTTKRRKTKNGDITRAAKVQRRKGRLSDLPNMPLDILYEIFSLLHPRDLDHVSRVSVAFRQMILAEQFVMIWKKSRELTGLPECPLDMSERAWSILVFGERICATCGSGRADHVVFYLKHRFCTRCITERLAFRSPRDFFDTYYYEYDFHLLQLIPCYKSDACRRISKGSRMFRAPDVNAMTRTLDEYRQRRLRDEPGWAEALDEYKTKTLAEIEDLMQRANLATRMYDEIQAEKSFDLATAVDSRKIQITQRLMDAGWKRVDIDTLFRSRHTRPARSANPLTDRGWKAIKPKLESTLADLKEERLKAATKTRLYKREIIVLRLYNEILENYAPQRWAHMPSRMEFLTLPFVTAVTEVEFHDDEEFDGDVVLDEERESVKQAFPCGLLDWKFSKIRELVMKLPSADLSFGGYDKETMGHATHMATVAFDADADDATRLNYATSVFLCDNAAVCQFVRTYGSQERPKVGLEDVLSHQCYTRNFETHPTLYERRLSTRLAFSEKGCRTAAVLVGLAGLDERHASADEMDALGMWFICQACPPSSHHWLRDWRQCIAHDLHEHSTHDPQWSRASERESAMARTRLSVMDPADDSCWSCLLCFAHLNSWEPKWRVLEHVKRSHDIQEPVEDTDFFMFKPFRRSFSGEFLVEE